MKDTIVRVWQDNGVAEAQLDVWFQKVRDVLDGNPGESLRKVARQSSGGVGYPLHAILEVIYLSRLDSQQWVGQRIPDKIFKIRSTYQDSESNEPNYQI